ncbi:hypothetical protein BC332_26110 [Capsicum chinense]|nr:hypothetical protein BC332_26110 [Capsicum chinense]
MTDKCRQYNALKKWFDRNCDITLDYPVRCRYLKNVLKSRCKAYLDWDDDMDVPNIPDLDSNSDTIFIKNPREVRSRGRTQINKNRSSHQNVFPGDNRRWGFEYYDVYDEG